MCRKIVITSGKGGVGKTTISANLGVKLAKFGFKTLVVDADFGLNNLDIIMGLENKVIFTIKDIFEKRCRAKQALIQDKIYPNLYILSSNNCNENDQISPSDFKKIIGALEDSFDYILIDCPAGIEMGFQRAIYSATEAIVVVTPHISSIRDAGKVFNLLNSYHLSSKFVLINKIRGDELISGEILSAQAITKLLNQKIIGQIPEDDTISTLQAMGVFAFNSVGARAFSLLAENIQNGTFKLFDCTREYRGVWGTLKRNIRRKLWKPVNNQTESKT